MIAPQRHRRITSRSTSERRLRWAPLDPDSNGPTSNFPTEVTEPRTTELEKPLETTTELSPLQTLQWKGPAHKLSCRFLDISQFLTAISRNLWRHLAQKQELSVLLKGPSLMKKTVKTEMKSTHKRRQNSCSKYVPLERRAHRRTRRDRQKRTRPETKASPRMQCNTGRILSRA